MIPKSQSPTRSQRSSRARRRCRAPSTASASDAATPTSSRSSPTCSSSSATQCVPPAKLKELREVSMLVVRAGEYHAVRAPGITSGVRLRAQGGAARLGESCATRTTYEHIDPASWSATIGACVLSELSGRANMMYKSKEIGLDIDPNNEKIGRSARGSQAARGRGLCLRGRRRLVRAADAAARSA